MTEQLSEYILNATPNELHTLATELNRISQQRLNYAPTRQQGWQMSAITAKAIQARTAEATTLSCTLAELKLLAELPRNYLVKLIRIIDQANLLYHAYHLPK
jgi:hypothetical protein